MSGSVYDCVKTKEMTALVSECLCVSVSVFVLCVIYMYIFFSWVNTYTPYSYLLNSN